MKNDLLSLLIVPQAFGGMDEPTFASALIDAGVSESVVLSFVPIDSYRTGQNGERFVTFAAPHSVVESPVREYRAQMDGAFRGDATCAARVGDMVKWTLSLPEPDASKWSAIFAHTAAKVVAAPRVAVSATQRPAKARKAAAPVFTYHREADGTQTPTNDAAKEKAQAVAR
jgi:hypothetical protein